MPPHVSASRPLVGQAEQLARAVADEQGLRQVQRVYYRARMIDQTVARARTINFAALRLAINDLIKPSAAGMPRATIDSLA